MSRAREFADLAGSVDAGGVTGRNLIINGAMNIAQRGTSSTGTGYQTVDRYSIQNSGNVTQSQEDLSSSDTPYSHGFRKTLKLLNTSNSDAAGDYVQAFQIIEAQNVATSGWDYTSSSSFVTIILSLCKSPLNIYPFAIIAGAQEFIDLPWSITSSTLPFSEFILNILLMKP